MRNKRIKQQKKAKPRRLTQCQILSKHRIDGSAYRQFSLKEANAFLPIVRSISMESAKALAPLQLLLASRVPADPRNADLQQEYAQIIALWSGKIERLGLKVHGLWQLGFDCGDGWYGWQLPERRVRYFLEYAQAFEQRTLLSRQSAKTPVLRSKYSQS